MILIGNCSLKSASSKKYLKKMRVESAAMTMYALWSELWTITNTTNSDAKAVELGSHLVLTRKAVVYFRSVRTAKETGCPMADGLSGIQKLRKMSS